MDSKNTSHIGNLQYLRWFLGIALRIPTAHDFPVISARKSVRGRAHSHNIRDFPQAKLDRELNARRFLWNEQGDPYFLFHNFNENSILNNREKN